MLERLEGVAERFARLQTVQDGASLARNRALIGSVQEVISEGQSKKNFSVATTESWKDKTSGEWQEKTEWHRIVSFGRLAEICGQYLHKGKQVYIEGKLQTRKWQDKNGNDRYTTEIVASDMQMLGGRGGGGGSADFNAAPASTKSSAAPSSGADEFDDDIPF